MRAIGAVCASLLALLPVAAAAQDIVSETQVVAAVDERPITFYVDRPPVAEKLPILLVVDGSGCSGQRRPSSWGNFAPTPDAPRAYARLMVEKPGVEPETPHGGECSAAFNRHYTIQNRVLDHLRVLQHLAATAAWWNGEVYLWGWSDGGDIGAQILTYRPDIRRAVLGAMGGGLTMAEHFERFWACPPESTDDRDSCLADLHRDFDAIRTNPSGDLIWNGESYATWASRLDSRLSAPLIDNRVPLLIVHGELDHENTPVESARQLVADLEAARNPAYEYWEVRGMEHGWNNLPQDRQVALRSAMLDWLLTGEVDAETRQLAVLGHTD